MSTTKKIQSALISVFSKDGLEPIVRKLHEQNVVFYSTGGTEEYIKNLGIPVIPVEDVTSYPSILGGRVKTLHPKVFGGILNRRENEKDQLEISAFGIPEIDMVIVDLYPFSETVKNESSTHQDIIEKIDIGGVSLIRAAGKNYKDVLIVSNKNQYSDVCEMLSAQDGSTSLEQRMKFAGKSFELTTKYDSEIAEYFYEV